MKDASLPLQAAIVASLRAALTTAGYSTPNSRVLTNPGPDDTMPYLALTGETGVPFRTKSTEGMECTVTITAWDDDPTDAHTLADYAIQDLTSRTSPLSVTGYTTAYSELDFRDSVQRVQEPPEEYWGVPFRIRFRLVET